MMPSQYLDSLIKAGRKEAGAVGRKVHVEEVVGIIRLLWGHRNGQKRVAYRKLMEGMTAEGQWGHTKEVARKWGVEITGDGDGSESEAETAAGTLPWKTAGGEERKGWDRGKGRGAYGEGGGKEEGGYNGKGKEWRR